MIPKKKDASKCRVKDQPYTIPKKDGRSASSVTQKNSVYSLDTLRMFGGVKSSPGGACSANRRRADSAHSQYSNASGGGRADDRARWLEKEDGHKRRDRNGRDGAKSSSSSSRHGGRPASGRGNSDKNDRYRRRNDRSVGPDLDSRGGPYGRSREYEDGDGRRGRRGERDERWDKGSGKSCPPPRSEKRRDASLVDLSGEAEDADLVDLSTEEDDTSLEGLSAEGDDELAEVRTCTVPPGVTCVRLFPLLLLRGTVGNCSGYLRARDREFVGLTIIVCGERGVIASLLLCFWVRRGETLLDYTWCSFSQN